MAAALATSLSAQPAHGHPVLAETATNERAAFFDRLRLLTKVYEDRNAAIRAGYRRIGIDFPSMGEHWVDPSRVIEPRFDATRPAMLAYTMVDGRPELVGVVFAIALAPNETAPLLPGADAFWHEHSGSVSDEALLSEHRTSPSDTAGTRVAVLHAWTHVANPAGPYATENWALPFRRLHLEVPVPLPLRAARAVSLATNGGGEEYFRMLFHDSASVVRAATAANVLLAHRSDPARLSAVDLNALDAIWRRLLDALSTNADALVISRMRDGSR
ncbi:MAG: hypothetical protein M3081_13440 [Gemmatimonadota bacterium]|nr:hypothetical protein [Gemmatimonadota bacterium]